ncbi:carboxypeptidase-like regulatory domain-containing protein [Priestia koreensis]|uniref:carboxypeptidase-like regulatory domain-containing protein n=1 Tax=Priestia koreensis TaxID=284581 RepID=UPI00203CB0B2|nr:carboxypeptidase-like regulatory domain-containing protein [Priestia koreensis]MCM3003473.1 carboxypeptidase-like regulatory domain-containing protein [Priestia koreensis]
MTNEKSIDLHGLVKDVFTNQPISNAKVELFVSDRVLTSFIAYTNEQGYFIIESPLSDVTPTITVTATDYETTTVELSRSDRLGNVELGLHPLFIDPYHLGHIYDVECYLTDKQGELVDLRTASGITFLEIGPRIPIYSRLYTDIPSLIHKIPVLIKGYVVIKVQSERGSFTTPPISFQKIETFMLYAPEGTLLDFQLHAANCEASIQCQPDEYGISRFQELTVSIDLHEHISVTAKEE